MPLAGLPAGALGAMTATGMNRFIRSFMHAAAALLAGIRAGRTAPRRLPRRLFQGAQWLDGKGWRLAASSA